MRPADRSALVLYAAVAALTASTLLASPAAGQPIGRKVADDGLTILQSDGVHHTSYKITDHPEADWRLNGLAVTAYWAGGASSTLVWGVTGFEPLDGLPMWGIAAGGIDLRHVYEEDRFFLVNTAATPLERLVFAGTTGGIVWDRTFGGAKGTGGSKKGYDFRFRDGAALVWETTALYTNIVRPIGKSPVGDLFETLDVTFGSGGLDPELEIAFKADWDYTTTTPTGGPFAAMSASATTAPEPGTGVLLGAGGAALVAAAARRRRKA